ncbi:hypothetical protein PR048_020628 [Dryococelus australis]|uniref:Uncharacterized protein n=1 Tax=Dryococelus australis TaxID=614101 RepID=A0ABQ9H6S8_9NEOP|nr:hypothetical protein PR048_020628 [Dryococelus australis]
MYCHCAAEVDVNLEDLDCLFYKYNQFTVTHNFPEALLKFYFQDIPPLHANIASPTVENYTRGTAHCIRLEEGGGEIPEKSRRSPGTIPTCENQRAVPAGNRTMFRDLDIFINGATTLVRLCALACSVLRATCPDLGPVWKEQDKLADDNLQPHHTWLEYSPPTYANTVRFPAGSLSDFRMWELCRTMPLVGGVFSGISLFPHSRIPALLYSLLCSLPPHRLSRPRVFTVFTHKTSALLKFPVWYPCHSDLYFETLESRDRRIAASSVSRRWQATLEHLGPMRPRRASPAVIKTLPPPRKVARLGGVVYKVGPMAARGHLAPEGPTRRQRGGPPGRGGALARRRRRLSQRVIIMPVGRQRLCSVRVLVLKIKTPQVVSTYYILRYYRSVGSAQVIAISGGKPYTPEVGFIMLKKCMHRGYSRVIVAMDTPRKRKSLVGRTRQISASQEGAGKICATAYVYLVRGDKKRARAQLDSESDPIFETLRTATYLAEFVGHCCLKLGAATTEQTSSENHLTAAYFEPMALYCEVRRFHTKALQVHISREPLYCTTQPSMPQEILMASLAVFQKPNPCSFWCGSSMHHLPYTACVHRRNVSSRGKDFRTNCSLMLPSILTEDEDAIAESTPATIKQR